VREHPRAHAAGVNVQQQPLLHTPVSSRTSLIVHIRTLLPQRVGPNLVCVELDTVLDLALRNHDMVNAEVVEFLRALGGVSGAEEGQQVGGDAAASFLV
jgi:hypothetical protein